MLNFNLFRLFFLPSIVLLFISVTTTQTGGLLNFGLNADDFVSEELLPVDLPHKNASYDFIIVGAGPAGCVLANRLSENPNWTIYLLEAGGKETIAHDIPVLAPLLQRTNSNWGYKSVPQKRACQGMNNNECALPRGKLLSGSSGINYMIYNRGNRRDFDRWAEAGNIGWSYDDVLPLFKRSESANLKGLQNSPYHNTSGPLSVEYVSYRSEIVHAFIKGAQEAGHKLNDYNGESQLGVSYVQATTKNGHRHTAAKAYLDPIMNKRKNLHILTFATVTKVLIDPETKSAYGVEFFHKNEKYEIQAKKEVILSAGAFNSPQLLMLSGIGPKDVLDSVGIPLIKELPVGKLLYDHMSFFGPIFTVNTTGQTVSVNRLSLLHFQEFKNGDPSTIFSTIGGVESLAFIKTPNSKEPSDMPDIELIVASAGFPKNSGSDVKGGANLRNDVYEKMFEPLMDKELFSFLVMQFHPKSVGYLSLRNKNPQNPPIINPKYFEVEEDIEFILEGIKEAIRISKTPAMQKINATLYGTPTPGCEDLEFGSDDYWRCSIRVLCYTVYHPVATCKMGPYNDSTSIVSPQLKVHDVGNLRVADTGIIPFPPTAHTNAASFMIGEKASDMIKDEWMEWEKSNS